MEFFMELLAEFFGEIFLELYLGAATCLLPEKKFSKRQIAFLKILSITVNVGALGALICGIIFLAEEHDIVTGSVLVAVGAFFMLLNFAVFIFASLRRRKDKKDKDLSKEE